MTSDQFDLPITIHFSEQTVQLLGGRVQFGLKGMELKLKLKNAEISYDSRYQPERIELSTYEHTEKITANYLPVVCQVTTYGSNSDPAWMFELTISSSVLKGSLQIENLGTLQVRSKPCQLRATVEVSLQHLCLTSVEGLYASNISRNKQTIANIAIKKELLRTKLQPYLSRAEVDYE
ncbi:MAG: hypothetical protein KME32_18385 [Mojavia pulchra JT2-VF2]|uniref:Uncharacterized protein n=1 Tax=Mojavia pulchra JT2-VF2 TaxID=287848 RepID=A0A951UI99_9NOST|nr:hypothetical protein [Mojavia pulchra JT2-VF2]